MNRIKSTLLIPLLLALACDPAPGPAAEPEPRACTSCPTAQACEPGPSFCADVAGLLELHGLEPAKETVEACESGQPPCSLCYRLRTYCENAGQEGCFELEATCNCLAP